MSDEEFYFIVSLIIMYLKNWYVWSADIVNFV